MRICIYCNKEKQDSDFSQEHVLPRALGGAIQPINPFSTTLVCARCNTISGFFIDAPFAKSWFINNYRADNAKRFIKLLPSTILPLVYFGIIDELKFEDKICEFYLGPTGDRIYHFHVPYPEEIDSPTMIGVPPHIRTKEIDYGFTFLFLRSNNPEWIPAVFNSVVDNFKKSKLYFGNGPTPKIKGVNFLDIPEDLKVLHQCMRSMNGKEHKNSFKVDIDIGNRFMAKLALGLGCLFLKDEFKASPDAALLRKYVWTKNFKERREFPIHGTGLLKGEERMTNVNELLKWEGAHILYLMQIGESLALYANFYGRNGAVIQITENRNHWRGLIDREIIYIVIPERQKCVGPITLEDYIGHKYSEFKNEQLTELENELATIEPLPPFELKEGGLF
jgi:hypothetical protein